MRQATEEIITKDNNIMVTNNINRISSTNMVVTSKVAIQGSSNIKVEANSNSNSNSTRTRTRTLRSKLPSRNFFPES